MKFKVSTPASIRQNAMAQLLKRGESIYSSCSACHGIEGEGIAPYPRLAGQQLDYIKQQLKNFKTGARVGKIMKMMVAYLTEDDIDALVFYLTMLNEEKLVDRNLSKWQY